MFREDEEEVLFPPRSFLEVVGEITYLTTEDGTVVRVVPLEVNANINSPLLEESLSLSLSLALSRSSSVSTLSHNLCVGVGVWVYAGTGWDAQKALHRLLCPPGPESREGIYTCTHAYMCVCLCVCVCARARRMHMHSCIHAYMCVCVCARSCTHRKRIHRSSSI